MIDVRHFQVKELNEDDEKELDFAMTQSDGVSVMNAQISKYLFSLNPKDSEYHFKDLNDFIIPIADIDSSHDLFIKPADDSSFDWLKIKTLN